MKSVLAIGAAAVVAVAALKTFLMVRFVLPPEQTSVTIISGLFALFTALTAAVAYVCFTQLRHLLETQRKKRVTPGEGTPLAKESVISQYAVEWGLSQAEADVAMFVVKGFSNNEIAEMRGCALATIKSQLGSIYSKSGFESRYQLIAFITDEVCEMAVEEPALEPRRASTRKILPLVGRSRHAA